MQRLDPENNSQFDAMYGQFLDALFEKDRLSYLGKIVRGLIHNINGPLQNISMLVEVLMRGQDQLNRVVRGPDGNLPEQWESHFQKQQQRFQRLTEQIFVLVEILRDFMVLQEIERNESEVDLKLVLNKLVAVFQADLFLKHQVDLELQIAEGIPLIRIFGRDLIPSLIHLFRNAIIAVRESERKKIVIECRKEEGRIWIVFRDSGCGFGDDQDKERLFELFYSNWRESSTKQDPPEKHLGFGLFAARRLLAPYGVSVSLERKGDETLTILEIPTTHERSVNR
jgi:signal transduction histidine kinase